MTTAQEFDELHAAARCALESPLARRAAIATITRTRGSTFRRAGTSMLVDEDGRVVCALAGGCPQRDLLVRAERVMASKQADLVHYNKDSNLDLMMEVGCGGELEVLIEPLTQRDDIRFLAEIQQVRASRSSGVMATIFTHDGTPIVPRPCRLIWSSDRLVWRDALPSRHLDPVIEQIAVVESSRTAVHEISTPDGRFDVLLQPLVPQHRLAIIGVNDESILLARLARQLGWEAMLVDHLPEPHDDHLIPDNIQRLFAVPEGLSSMLRPDRFTSVVLMTHAIERDIAYLQALAHEPLCYLGALGSRQRAERMRSAVPAAAERLKAPAGLDIGSETPLEIAMAIASEIIATLNARKGGSLASSQGEIHTTSPALPA
ncbi:XdhC family protein [Dyella choica]|uniref:XdhC family protein n=1 Tax=Dyella choica TaxID=1927959 RepID=A0A3S0Q6P4_9GAMM|nr:XdhC family protein [Dyella choica]RUL78986.1 XdhC family protein [Dyella choica]